MSDDESRAIFREEALDLLAELDATLLELENSPHDLDLVNQVFRALHTIKGSGAMFGFDDIANFTHSIENVFDKVRTGGLEVSSELITTTLAARDHILGLLNGVDEEGNGSPERGEAIQADVRDLVNGVAVVTEPVAVDTALEAPVEPVSYRIRIRPREPKVDKELSLDPLFEDLRALGRCEVRVDMSKPFELVSDFTPKGDQPAAIAELVANIEAGVRDQVLLGVTGSGKTFTVANLVAQLNRPALVLAPNKTLAAQLFNEFKGLFPNNAVEYFVSYYDYYQPEAYLPHSDTYIEKDSSINDDIDKLRHAATHVDDALGLAFAAFNALGLHQLHLGGDAQEFLDVLFYLGFKAL